MRTYEAFVLGAITSGLVAWIWGKEITGYVRDQTCGVRTKAAEGLQAVADGTAKALDRGGDALRRAEEFLQDAKEPVDTALRKGQDAIRPTPSTREA